MNIQIEIKNESRRILDEKGFKIYGSDTELRAIADAIYAALGNGLVTGWVGIGEHDKKTAFPNNGIPNLPTKSWQDSLSTIPTIPTPP